LVVIEAGIAGLEGVGLAGKKTYNHESSFSLACLRAKLQITFISLQQGSNATSHKNA